MLVTISRLLLLETEEPIDDQEFLLQPIRTTVLKMKVHESGEHGGSVAEAKGDLVKLK